MRLGVRSKLFTISLLLIVVVVVVSGLILQTRVTIIGSDGRVLGDSDLDLQGLRTVENHSERPEFRTALPLYRVGELRRSLRGLLGVDGRVGILAMEGKVGYEPASPHGSVFWITLPTVPEGR